MPRLPQVGGDNNDWGNVLNEFLTVAHNTDGTIKQSAVSGLTTDLAAKVSSANSSMTVNTIWVGNQAAYNNLSASSTTLYFIV
jgi:hypothetical protein